MLLKSMVSFLSAIAVFYLALVGCLYYYQRNLLYIPDRQVAAPQQYGLEGFEDLRATSADGVNVQLWYRKAAPNFPTVIYFHGNAAHLGNRAGIFAALAGQGFGVLALSYRGYGASEGSPTEDGIYHDARCAIAYLTEKHSIPLTSILLFGESLGTGVAIQMATEYNIAGVVLEAPYTSVAARAAEIYFYVPVNLLIKDRFDSLSKAPRVKAPVLILHGELDNVIPVQQGRALYAAITSAKKAIYFPRVAHNDFDTGEISAHVLDFAREHRLIAQ
jgi:uncharacterized protein